MPRACKRGSTHVTRRSAVEPIIYTGKYFWQDNVGDADVTASPLWHAQYTSASCPNIADAVAGLGDLAVLVERLGRGHLGQRRHGSLERRSSRRSRRSSARRWPCAQLPADGGVIDDGDPCFVGGGPSTSMRHVTDAGDDGDLVWTHTTEDTEEANYGQWNLDLAAAGHYQIEVYTAAAYAQSKQADYLVHTADGDTSVTIDQTAVDGWQTLGTFAFAAGADQYVHLGDNTGEPLANSVQMVFDAVRVTRGRLHRPGLRSDDAR